MASFVAHPAVATGRPLPGRGVVVLAGWRAGASHGVATGRALPGRGRGVVVLAGQRIGAGDDVATGCALPGRGAVAVVLAGQRVGAGHSRVLVAATFKAPGRDVKAACAKDSADPPSVGDEDEFFEWMYKHHSKKFDDFLGLYMPLPDPLPMEEKAVQEKLKDIAEKCIALNYGAMRRLPRAEKRRLTQVFWQAHHAFAVVRSRATYGRASMGMAVVLAEKLYVVLKMVSSGCSTPLPLDIKKEKKMLIPFTAPVFPLDHGVEVQMLQMVDNFYNDVKADIDAMISRA